MRQAAARVTVTEFLSASQRDHSHGGARGTLREFM